MYCNKCGNQIAEDQKFCPFCGEAVVKAAEETPVTEEPQAEETPVVEEAPKAEEPKVEPTVVDANGAPVVEKPKLNVGMLIWSIINTVLGCCGSCPTYCCTSVNAILGIVALVMTILAKTGAPEKAEKKLKIAKILNLVSTILLVVGVIGFVVLTFVLPMFGVGSEMMAYSDLFDF